MRRTLAILAVAGLVADETDDDEGPVQAALNYCTASSAFGYTNANGEELGEVRRFENERS
ncbi:hypothetical protein [Candidatus Poriferisodalis sp.]|uniref:hypothetical protein n=1 Tax=Candidatus Poriferisodalis sp. TaxID=3101277 RepID=UPI003B5C5A92